MLLQLINLMGSFILELHLFPSFRALIVFHQERGMSRPDAEDVIEKMAKYDDFFVNLMMNEELGLQVCSQLTPGVFRGKLTGCCLSFSYSPNRTVAGLKTE